MVVRIISKKTRRTLGFITRRSLSTYQTHCMFFPDPKNEGINNT